MPATKRLVLDLPEATVDMIEAQVAAGRFSSASAFVAARLDADEALPPELETLDWVSICAEAEEEEQRIEAGLERTYPLDEVFDELRVRTAQRARESRASA